jgi:hypothetical protein
LKKVTIDLGKVWRVTWGIGKVAAVITALAIANECVAMLYTIAKYMFYTAQFMSKATGA